MVIRSKGTHTFDIFQEYLSCPMCGLIIESRVPYLYQNGKYEKKMVCPRCSYTFVVEKQKKHLWSYFK